MVALDPFLTARLVCFALLAYFSFLGLVFEAWHLSAVSATGAAVPGIVVLLLLMTCTLSICVALGLAALWSPKLKTAHVAFECIWTALTSTIYLIATIGVTVSSSGAKCQTTTAFCNVSASLSLIVPIAWVTFLILLTYTFAVLISSLALMDKHPNIWFTTVTSVPWFASSIRPSERRPPIRSSSTSSTSSDSDDDDSLWEQPKPTYGDLEKASTVSYRGNRNRRGVDTPFPAKPRPRSPDADTNYSVSLINVPHLPRPSYSTTTASHGSRHIEVIRESQTITRPGGTYLPTINTPRVDSFPIRVASDDLPIPLPHLSEWIKADAVRT